MGQAASEQEDDADQNEEGEENREREGERDYGANESGVEDGPGLEEEEVVEEVVMVRHVDVSSPTTVPFSERSGRNDEGRCVTRARVAYTSPATSSHAPNAGPPASATLLPRSLPLGAHGSYIRPSPGMRLSYSMRTCSDSHMVMINLFPIDC